jgi:hypothetical protein
MFRPEPDGAAPNTVAPLASAAAAVRSTSASAAAYWARIWGNSEAAVSQSARAVVRPAAALPAKPADSALTVSAMPRIVLIDRRQAVDDEVGGLGLLPLHQPDAP